MGKLLMKIGSVLSMVQGRRNEFGIGGGGQKNLEPCKIFFITLFFQKIQFCSLVYL